VSSRSWPSSSAAVVPAPGAAALERRREWLVALGLVILLKGIVLAADPDPRFFMGDSVTYLRTALEGVIPKDRSFLYGALIWLTAVLPHSLHGLVAAQAAAGVVSALLVYAICRPLLGLPFAPSLAAAVLVAVEPAQLFYERMVMAEAFGNVPWLASVACMLAYAKDGRLRWLLGAVLGGIVSASLRQNAILVSIVIPIVLPLVRRALTSPRPEWRACLAHVAVAALATSALHGGYRHLVGHLTHEPPGYIGMAGVFKLGLVAPLVKPEQFAGTGCPPDILKRVAPPLTDPWLREIHIWRGDGLWPVMQRTCKDPEDAARLVADRALESDPLGLLPMSWSIVRQHFDDPSARWRMDSDLGRNWMGNDFLAVLRTNFGLEAHDIPFRDTLTSRLFDGSRWWLTWTYFLTPVWAAALAWLARRRRDAPAMAFASVAGLLFLSQLLFSHILSYRYLYAFPVLAIVAGAWWAGAGFRRPAGAALGATG
jgi:hypothetical protein